MARVEANVTHVTHFTQALATNLLQYSAVNKIVQYIVRCCCYITSRSIVTTLLSNLRVTEISGRSVYGNLELGR
jgi:hypothetical protein